MGLAYEALSKYKEAADILKQAQKVRKAQNNVISFNF
jgi:hypothetical protein